MWLDMTIFYAKTIVFLENNMKKFLFLLILLFVSTHIRAAANPKNLYQVLGIERTNDLTEIKKAYRNKAKLYHPDTTSEDKNTASILFAEVQNAYDILNDPQKKRFYDVLLAERTDNSHEEILAALESVFSRNPQPAPEDPAKVVTRKRTKTDSSGRTQTTEVKVELPRVSLRDLLNDTNAYQEFLSKALEGAYSEGFYKDELNAYARYDGFKLPKIEWIVGSAVLGASYLVFNWLIEKIDFSGLVSSAGSCACISCCTLPTGIVGLAAIGFIAESHFQNSSSRKSFIKAASGSHEVFISIKDNDLVRMIFIYDLWRLFLHQLDDGSKRKDFLEEAIAMGLYSMDFGMGFSFRLIQMNENQLKVVLSRMATKRKVWMFYIKRVKEILQTKGMNYAPLIPRLDEITEKLSKAKPSSKKDCRAHIQDLD